jgi:hypothetical protein
MSSAVAKGGSAGCTHETLSASARFGEQGSLVRLRSALLSKASPWRDRQNTTPSPRRHGDSAYRSPSPPNLKLPMTVYPLVLRLFAVSLLKLLSAAMSCYTSHSVPFAHDKPTQHAVQADPLAAGAQSCMCKASSTRHGRRRDNPAWLTVKILQSLDITAHPMHLHIYLEGARLRLAGPKLPSEI